MFVLYNAKIYTLSPSQPSATALVVDGGRILASGTDAEILSSFQSADLVDAKGCAVIPGLTDAHIHLESYALSLQKIDCETPTQAECLQQIAKRASTTPPGEWIFGHGWNQ